MVQGIPKSEKIWTTSKTLSGNTYYITAKITNRDTYFIYKLIDGKAVKLGKHKHPNILSQKYVK